MKFLGNPRVFGRNAICGVENQNLKPQRAQRPQRWARLVTVLLFGTAFFFFATSAEAQNLLPFEVSNPGHVKWSSEEAGRIYWLGCERVARSIRPEHPPKLHPSFVLVLGTKEDQTVRNGSIAEVHLKSWNAAHFAEAVVIMATREILKGEDVRSLARDTLMAAEASVSVDELRGK